MKQRKDKQRPVATVGDLMNIHSDIAKGLGTRNLLCRKCKHKQVATDKEMVEYLKSGWPKHCGQTMTLL